jgi:hypothetical protein
MTMTTTSIVLLALLAQAAPAAPAQDKAKAKALLGEGTSLYDKGDYTGALEKFHAAYAAYASAKIWFNIGQANRDLGRPVDALEAFEKFLTGVPDAAPEDKADAQASVAEIQSRLGQLKIVCETPGSEISVDGKAVGPAPLAKPVWVAPGTHQVLAMKQGAAPVVESAEVSAGGTTTVVLRGAQPPAPAPPPAAPALVEPEMPAVPAAPVAPPVEVVAAPAPARTVSSEARQGGHTWTWVMGSSTVLLTGAAAAVGFSVKSRFEELRDSCGLGSTAKLGCSEEDISSLRTRRNIANVLWGVAGAAAVTTIVLLFVEGRPVAVAPVVGETTGMVARMEF